MSGTNHVAGGLVFTGIFASFWNVNIFSQPEYIAATAFFAILPDIDHLKSPIGKAFYPVAKWLDRRYGHRTITHSLTVYVPGILLVMVLESVLGQVGHPYTLLFAFAYFSHLLFDMLTRQGVPLFYPFKKNPCVIPGNPELRLRSSDLRTEAACFGIFILLGITCQNLFAQGFWNTYNRQFNDVKHLHQESRLSETMLLVKYAFRSPGNRAFSGSGLLVHSSESRAILYEGGRFISLTSADRIKQLQPTRTGRVLTTRDVTITNVTPDSLNRLLRGKAIMSLLIQSNAEFSFMNDFKPESGKRAELSFVTNPVFDFVAPSAPILPLSTDTTSGRRRVLQYELSRELSRQTDLRAAKYRLTADIARLSDQIPAMELYDREKATHELENLRRDLANSKEIEDNSTRIRLQIQSLDTRPSTRAPTTTDPTKINGYLTYLLL